MTRMIAVALRLTSLIDTALTPVSKRYTNVNGLLRLVSPATNSRKRL
jgi:hypothetical protein